MVLAFKYLIDTINKLLTMHFFKRLETKLNCFKKFQKKKKKVHSRSM